MTTADGALSGVPHLVHANNSAAGTPNLTVLLVGDGYRVSELPVFETDCKAFAQTMMHEPWHAPSLRYVIYRQNVCSTDSGASVSAGAGKPPIARKTYFDSCYGGGGLGRILQGTEPTAKAVAKLVAQQVNSPKKFYFYRVVVLVNDSLYGGSCGGAVTWVPSRHQSSAGLFLHELGHVMELADEYDHYFSCEDMFVQWGAKRPDKHNIDNQPANPWWASQRTELPGPTVANQVPPICLPPSATAAYSDSQVGAFEGAGWYRVGSTGRARVVA